MKLRYMVEFKFVRNPRRSDDPHYVPIGVWVVGPGDGLDLTLQFLPGHNTARKRAAEVLDRMEQYGMRAIPDGFLEYHQQTISGYVGMRGEIITTSRYPSAAACARDVLKRIREGKIT